MGADTPKPDSHYSFLSHLKQPLLSLTWPLKAVSGKTFKNSFKVTDRYIFLKCIFSWKILRAISVVRNSGNINTNGDCQLCTTCSGHRCAAGFGGPGGRLLAQVSVAPVTLPWKSLVSWQELLNQHPSNLLEHPHSHPDHPRQHTSTQICSHALPLQLCPPEEEKLSHADKRGPGRPGWVTACGTGYLQMADWLYAGPSVALRACPTWVWVRPRDRRRILKALANSRISSRLTPSTSPAAVWGSVEMFSKTGSIYQQAAESLLSIMAHKEMVLTNSGRMGKPTPQNLLFVSHQAPVSRHLHNHPSRYFYGSWGHLPFLLPLVRCKSILL